MKIKKAVKKIFKYFSKTIADEKGFNLVEMGIVLAIVGLLMGGAVMKGPALITSAKNKIKFYSKYYDKIYFSLFLPIFYI